MRDVILKRKCPLLWNNINAHVCKACALTHTYVPKVVYRICCSWFPHANCQTINPAKQVFINLIKLIHNLIIRPSLIIEKKYFLKFLLVN